MTVVDVLSEGTLDTESADKLLWVRLIPQQYIPDTVTETGSYIMYDIDENVVIQRNSANSTYTELTLYFWLLTHKDTKPRSYNGHLRNDILNRELKLMFNDTQNMGISKNHLIFNKIFTSTNKEYIGRYMAFKITDWSDKVRYGKK